MISQVPRNPRFGNKADIEHLHEWQKLNRKNQQMLYHLEASTLTSFRVQILIPNQRYKVFYYPVAGQSPRALIATSVKGVWDIIEEFELERRVYQN